MSLTARFIPDLRRAAAVAFSLLALPAAAHGADAPLRTIGVGTDGKATTGFYPVAISADGTRVLGNLIDQPAVRDVTGGKWTLFGQKGDGAIGASLDLTKVLVYTGRRADPADTDNAADLYLFDRSTGTTKLITTPAVLPEDPALYTTFGDAAISGDGGTVQFWTRRQAGTAPGKDVAYRYDVRTGGTTVVADLGTEGAYLLRSHAIDNAGQVTVNATGIYAGTRKVALPPNTSANRVADTWVSPDGKTVVVRQVASQRLKFFLVDVVTGAIRTVTVPSWLQGQAWDVLAVSNDGAGAVIGVVLNRGQGPRYVVGTITPAGSVTQIGGDIKVTDASRFSAISQNLRFAATNLHLAQLGTAPLPGIEPGASTLNTDPLAYVSFTDVVCIRTLLGDAWIRARVTNAASPVGTDTRYLVKSDWVVYETTTKKVLNAFTLSGAGKGRDLTVPRTGGYTLTYKVTLSDGATLSGLSKVASHPTPTCQVPF